MSKNDSTKGLNIGARTPHLRRRDDFVVGLDIGTTKICAIIGKATPEDQIDIIGIGTSPSRGLHKGVVISLEDTIQSISQAIEEAERMAQLQARSVYAGIAGGHIRGFTSRGTVPIAQNDRVITKRDIQRATNAAQAIAIPLEREVIHVLPQEYIVDDTAGIKEPVGMSGVRLEAVVHIVTGAVTSAQNIIKSVNSAGFRVEDIILQPLASAEAVLTPDEKELGVVLVDIGGGTSDIVVFVENSIWHTAVLALGGDNITKDISIGLRTPVASAERIKKTYGCALSSLVGDDEMIPVPGVGAQGERQLPRRVLTEIIEPRTEEIFTLIREEIRKTGYEELIAGGVVITGGASLMEGLPQLAEEILEAPVRVGLPKGISGLVAEANSPIYATGVGLVMYGLLYKSMGRVSRFTDGHLFTKVVARMKEWFEEFF